MSEVVQLKFPQASGVFSPVDHTPEGLRAWILETCRYLSLTPTELAKAANLAASTVNRFLREKDSGSLSARTLEALLATARKLEADNEFRLKLDAPTDSSDRPYLVDVAVLGRARLDYVQADNAWTERLYRLRLPVRAPYHTMPIGAFELADDHAEPVFANGSIVVVTPITKDGPWPHPPSYVTMFWPGHKTEPRQKGLQLTIRKLIEGPNGDMWITPISSSSGIEDLRFQSLEYPYGPHSLVIGSYHFRK